MSRTAAHTGKRGAAGGGGVGSNSGAADSLRSPTGLTLLLAAVAALGAVLVLARQVPYGVGLHWDSGNYLASARSLLAGEGFREYSGAVYVAWPPLYPLVLAVASLDVMDPLDVAGPVNAALFGFTIFMVGQYLRRRLKSRFLVVWAALAIALAAPLAGQAAIAMAGTAFILLVTLTLIHTDAFLAKGRASSLVWAGACAALAWQTRYLGAALLAAVTVMLLSQRGARPLQRVRRAAGFALLAGAPMAVWLVRNRLVSGAFTGRPRGTVRSSWVALTGIGEELWSWAAFDLPMFEWPAVGIVGFLAAVALAAACGVLVRERWRRRTRPSPSGWLPCSVFGGFAAAYFLALTVSLALGATAWGFEERHLTPLYVPLLVTAALALDRVLDFAPRRRAYPGRRKRRWAYRPQAAAAVVTAALCFWTAGQIEPHVREIRRSNAEGYDHASSYWAGSETLQWIRRNPLEGWIVSNEALVVSIHNYTLELGPGQGYRHLPDEAEDMENLLRAAGDRDESYYVVLIGTDSEWLMRNLEYDVADLRASSGLEPIAELADGAVFRVRPSDETAPADSVE